MFSNRTITINKDWENRYYDFNGFSLWMFFGSEFNCQISIKEYKDWIFKNLIIHVIKYHLICWNVEFLS
jgi:hypothetical protein